MQSHNVEEDTRAVYEAMKGFGTDESALISVLMQRPKDHIQAVRSKFQELYGKDLVARIKSECGGAAERALQSVVYSEDEACAVFLNEGMAGRGTDEDVIVDCICTKTPLQIRKLEKVYNEMMTIHMRTRIKLETSSDLQAVFDACMSDTRPENGINEAEMQADMDAFYAATEGKLGTDEARLSTIIATRSVEHCHMLNKRYSERSPKGRTAVEVIVSETSGAHQHALMACFSPPGEWFAYRIADALKGIGTDEEPLLRSVFLASQHQLHEAEDVLEKKHNINLIKRVQLETSGVLDKLLVTYLRYVMTQ